MGRQILQIYPRQVAKQTTMKATITTTIGGGEGSEPRVAAIPYLKYSVFKKKVKTRKCD